MNILYLGDKKPTTGSAQRARAFVRLGHTVEHHDPESSLVVGQIARVWHYRTGYRYLQSDLASWLKSKLGVRRFDVAWVDSGAVVGPDVVKTLRIWAPQIVNYNCDDPTGPRDWCRWHSFRQAIQQYDALVVVRDESNREYRAHQAKRVLQVMRSYDEVDLAPRDCQTAGDSQRWSSEVLFAGTWMPERGPFLAELIRLGVPLTIYGDRWMKAPEWNELKAAYRGPAIEGGDYLAAMRGTKIALGLLSKGNRDLHTIRSSEIPYMGVLFCAERTREHSAMYVEGKEAVFWSSAEECSRACKELLSDAATRQRIAEAGRQKVLSLGLSHREVLAKVLSGVYAAH